MCEVGGQEKSLYGELKRDFKNFDSPIGKQSPQIKCIQG